MKTVPCDFCGSSQHTIRYQLQDWLTRNPGQFTLVECACCGLLYLNPRPSWQELEPFYPREYHAYRPPQANKRKTIVQRVKNVVWQRRSRAVQKRQPEGRLLDIGCATGEFLAEMGRNPGWECHGVEPVPYAAEIARQNSHAEIFEGDLLDARYSDSFFDVVTLWDVLEHTSAPGEMLREIRRILRPGGLLVIRAPDPASFLARAFGPYWTGYDAPRHLFGFPRPLLEKRLQEDGYRNIETTYLSGEHFPFFASLSSFLKDKRYVWMGKITGQMAYSTVARVILAPVFFSLSLLHKGSAPVYFARKRDATKTTIPEGHGKG